VASRKPTHATPRVHADWNRLVERLTRVLNALPEDHYLILTVPGRHRFVQFVGTPDGGLRGESVSNAYLEPHERLTQQQERALARLGWHAPTLVPTGASPREQVPGGSPNWFVDLVRPVNGKVLRQLVSRTFAEVYGVRHPSGLRYSAFHADGEPLPLPGLGLEAEEGLYTETEPASLEERLTDVLVTTADAAIVLEDDAGAYEFAVDGVVLRVRVDDEGRYARIMAALRDVDAPTPELLLAINELNANRLEFGYVYWREGQLRYGVEILLDPLHTDVLPVALHGVAGLVQALRDELSEDPSNPPEWRTGFMTSAGDLGATASPADVWEVQVAG
jgi:hypothetical protein